MKRQHPAGRRKRQSVESFEEVETNIRKRAYELYELRGREDGRDLDDWLKAESELRKSANRQ